MSKNDQELPKEALIAASLGLFMEQCPKLPQEFLEKASEITMKELNQTKFEMGSHYNWGTYKAGCRGPMCSRAGADYRSYRKLEKEGVRLVVGEFTSPEDLTNEGKDDVALYQLIGMYFLRQAKPVPDYLRLQLVSRGIPVPDPHALMMNMFHRFMTAPLEELHREVYSGDVHLSES